MNTCKRLAAALHKTIPFTQNFQGTTYTLNRAKLIPRKNQTQNY